MRYITSIIFTAFLVINSFSQDDIRISGRVTDGTKPLADVSIRILDTEIGTFTDSEGRYSIAAKPRQTVVFSYTGMTTIEYISEDVNAVINMEMYPDVQMLDEVVVQKRRKSQKDLEKEYAINKRLIKTGFGIIDQDRVGYSMRVIDGDRLSVAGIDFIGSLQSYVPGLRINRPNGISNAGNRFGTDATKPLVFLPRRFMTFQNPRPVAYEVDGQLMTDAPIELQVFNIERIAVISAVSALAKYGQIAAGGLIVINTKGGVFDPSVKYGQSFDRARKWDNVFDKQKLGRVNRIPMNQALEELYQIDKYDDALAFIEDQSLLSTLSVYNQFEVANVFLERWNNEKRYLETMHKIIATKKSNPVLLKVAAYQLEANGFAEEALELYKEILRLRPNYAQSYRDLANIHAQFGDTQKSINYLSRYIRHVSLDTLSTAAKGIDSIIFAEYDNLLAKSGLERYDKRIAGPDDRGNVRLVFEWSHGDSEFELQFVNPEKNYFTWQHSLKDTPERIKEEKLKGYTSEQFFIDETMPGKWQVNMKYLGNRSFDPTYLKLTVFYNYGTPFEKQETFVHKLSAKNVNYELLSFFNSPIVSAAAR